MGAIEYKECMGIHLWESEWRSSECRCRSDQGIHLLEWVHKIDCKGFVILDECSSRENRFGNAQFLGEGGLEEEEENVVFERDCFGRNEMDGDS